DYRTTMSIVGGLRIKRIRSRTDGAETIKTYEYSGSVNQMIQSDMYRYKQTRYYTAHCVGCGFTSPEIGSPIWEYSTSVPLYSITGWGDCPVFYDTVTEYIGTTQSNQGKKVSQYRKSHRIRQTFPLPLPDKFVQNLYRFWSPYYNYDQGLLVPLLTSEKDYEFTENGYSLKKETVNEYLPVDMGQVTCGVRLSLRDDWIHLGIHNWGDHFAPYLTIDKFLYNMEYYDIIGYRYFLLPSKTRTTEYTVSGNINTTISYAYDASYRSLSPVKTTTSGSDTATLEETVLYPFNMNTAPYTTMVQNNIMDAVIKKTRLYNNSSKSIQYNYRAEGLKFVQNNILTGNNSLETRITYHTYDFYGNPVYVSKDNAEQVVYLWSYNGQYLVAEIKGATYEQVKTALGGRLPESLSSEASPNMTLINGLRTALSAAMVTVYTYRSLVGVTSVTKPNGEKFTYEYDNFGRLVMIKDHDGKVVEQYGYNYKN
ncbi:RHS repeat domain-containing protein, partial [Bacteroides sp. UBA939]|uniref:RHS repeat domain-containing protein n=1 Tax=Bacteroides sp. UBA939 TaxID=1946092 RepID=UPI0025C09340